MPPLAARLMAIGAIEGAYVERFEISFVAPMVVFHHRGRIAQVRLLVIRRRVIVELT